MKKVRIEDAAGLVLAHDLTKIIPGEFKGPAFKKGYVIKKEDVEILKDMGKYHIYVLELNKGDIHENEAAERIARAIAGDNIYFSGPSEGKIELKAKKRGIVKINVEGLNKINEIDDIVVATIHTNTLVGEGQNLAATRIIPLVIKDEKIKKVEELGREYYNNIITVKALKPLRIGVVVVGTEVYEGRIKDKFLPVMEEKIKRYGCSLIGTKYSPDDTKLIENKIKSLIEKGADIVLTCGGMSVDADDVTPQAIRNAADRVVSYGIPAIPGNMLMLAYRGKIAIFGIPGSAIYVKNTSLDLLLPRVLAGETLTRKDMISYGHGGLCPGCKVCVFPDCPFGK
ncbi:molybdopterin-binding protein [Fonticella tunisiensis]|uniref:Molybdopterin molybdenumtransferase n=1 Tax=Fonticella tunisiensis TaxID=1096341 RepID=A0A4R7KV84_9CLOT|nr:molybdopterin-binding protein [Fonticella tunisiensis]TDT63674.1 molybdenum cofactor synthesis domain-containing protein [Fonticella tunisiensis]